MSLRSLANDANTVLDCIRTGKIDEDLFVMQQNIADELTAMAIKEESNATTDNENV